MGKFLEIPNFPGSDSSLSTEDVLGSRVEDDGVLRNRRITEGALQNQMSLFKDSL